MITLLFVIFFMILIGLILNSPKYSNSTICNKQLTDNEYLQHMITHHEVAVYMSEKHLHNTHNPKILNIIRQLIRTQKYEIFWMKNNINNSEYDDLNDEMSDNTIRMNKNYYFTQGDYINPNTLGLTNTFCNPDFFNINHNEHNSNMTDESYIQHMIPHHQIAVDMSKRILKTTTNDFIIYLAYRIIRSQQLEIYELTNITKSNYTFNSILL
jgi:uncharacterized protein (DUF305 family)